MTELASVGVTLKLDHRDQLGHHRDCTMKSSISLTVIEFFPKLVCSVSSILRTVASLDCRTNSSKESKTTILATAASSTDCNSHIPVPIDYVYVRISSYSEHFIFPRGPGVRRISVLTIARIVAVAKKNPTLGLSRLLL